MNRKALKRFQQQRARRRAYVTARNMAQRNAPKTRGMFDLQDVSRSVKRPGNYMEAVAMMAARLATRPGVKLAAMVIMLGLAAVGCTPRY